MCRRSAGRDPRIMTDSIDRATPAHTARAAELIGWFVLGVLATWGGALSAVFVARATHWTALAWTWFLVVLTAVAWRAGRRSRVNVAAVIGGGVTAVAAVVAWVVWLLSHATDF